jgi:SAM-dependent methyltransferase
MLLTDRFTVVAEYSRARVYQDETCREIQEILDNFASQEPLRRVLDAGCGSELPLDFPTSVHLIGVDASAEALAKNENVDEAIVGDLETYDFGAGSLDAVLCWTVLEHVKRPDVVMKNLVRALRPGGLLIVGVPNVWSFKGLITKLTPYRFHVWAYRHLLGNRDAGKPGSNPYRTYLRLSMSPSGLAGLARAGNLTLVYARTYGGTPSQLPRMLRATWSGLAALVKAITLGRFDPNASEYAVVFRKNA